MNIIADKLLRAEIPPHAIVESAFPSSRTQDIAPEQLTPYQLLPQYHMTVIPCYI